MGACCTKERSYGGGYMEDDGVAHRNEYYEAEEEEEDNVRCGDDGARIRLQGCSRNISMYTQQGRKGINQDAMTVWEDFTEKGMYFCGVFDGHGPEGHKVARCVRDNLPSKLSEVIKIYQLNTGIFSDIDVAGSEINANNGNNHDRKRSRDISLPSWEASFVKSFKEMDEELSVDNTIDSFCSGSTAVTVVKQGDNLVIANLGDSRAVLGTRSGEKNQIVPVQLTVDLKPDTPSEAERIMKCKGRILSVDEEPQVYRLWMPDEDCPGLAMARAFGDFCVKDYGLISIPEVFYRKISSDDEFVVLATDGVWDALTNTDVVKIVASARKRSMAAELLVRRAVRAWKRKFPASKIDDCAAICLYLKDKPASSLTHSTSHVSRLGKVNDSELSLSYYSTRSNIVSDQGGTASEINSKMTEDWKDTVLNCNVSQDAKEELNALKEVERVNTMLKLPRFSNGLSRRKTSGDYEEVQAH
ncbi:hypothetical protein ACFX13_033753 [Malus domestica]|uniref:probable protein phosphatase 2C 65 n=1 Tax=Malus domestica TaxID=3750 RepID=UPI003975F166